jgi:hypothetical protein
MMSRLLNVVRRHPIITFFVLSYAISWAFLPIEAVRFMAGGPFIAALIVISLSLGSSPENRPTHATARKCERSR